MPPLIGGVSRIVVSDSTPNASAESPALTGPSAADAGLSFGELFRQQAPYVMGLLTRLGVGRADVEDVAQEVFLTIHRKLPGFEGRSTVKTWVCGICLRKASDYRRRAHRRRELLSAEPGAHQQASGARPDETALLREDARALQDAIDALPEKQMQVFVLYELEELSMAEVARAVGCPRFTGYTRLRAARKAIAARLRASGDEAKSGRST